MRACLTALCDAHTTVLATASTEQATQQLQYILGLDSSFATAVKACFASTAIATAASRGLRAELDVAWRSVATASPAEQPSPTSETRLPLLQALATAKARDMLAAAYHALADWLHAPDFYAAVALTWQSVGEAWAHARQYSNAALANERWETAVHAMGGEDAAASHALIGREHVALRLVARAELSMPGKDTQQGDESACEQFMQRAVAVASAQPATVSAAGERALHAALQTLQQSNQGLPFALRVCEAWQDPLAAADGLPELQGTPLGQQVSSVRRRMQMAHATALVQDGQHIAAWMVLRAVDVTPGLAVGWNFLRAQAGLQLPAAMQRSELAAIREACSTLTTTDVPVCMALSAARALAAHDSCGPDSMEMLASIADRASAKGDLATAGLVLSQALGAMEAVDAHDGRLMEWAERLLQVLGKWTGERSLVEDTLQQGLALAWRAVTSAMDAGDWLPASRWVDMVLRHTQHLLSSEQAGCLRATLARALQLQGQQDTAAQLASMAFTAYPCAHTALARLRVSLADPAASAARLGRHAQAAVCLAKAAEHTSTTQPERNQQTSCAVRLAHEIAAAGQPVAAAGVLEAELRRLVTQPAHRAIRPVLGTLQLWADWCSTEAGAGAAGSMWEWLLALPLSELRESLHEPAHVQEALYVCQLGAHQLLQAGDDGASLANWAALQALAASISARSGGSAVVQTLAGVQAGYVLHHALHPGHVLSSQHQELLRAAIESGQLHGANPRAAPREDDSESSSLPPHISQFVLCCSNALPCADARDAQEPERVLQAAQAMRAGGALLLAASQGKPVNIASAVTAQIHPFGHGYARYLLLLSSSIASQGSRAPGSAASSARTAQDTLLRAVVQHVHATPHEQPGSVLAAALLQLLALHAQQPAALQCWLDQVVQCVDAGSVAAASAVPAVALAWQAAQGAVLRQELSVGIGVMDAALRLAHAVRDALDGATLAALQLQRDTVAVAVQGPAQATDARAFQAVLPGLHGQQEPTLQAAWQANGAMKELRLSVQVTPAIPASLPGASEGSVSTALGVRARKRTRSEQCT